MKQLQYIGTFLGGVAAILTILYSPALFGKPPSLPGFPPDALKDAQREAQTFKDQRDSARRQLDAASEAHRKIESELREKDSEISRLRNDLRNRDTVKGLTPDPPLPPGSTALSPVLSVQRTVRLLGSDVLRMSLTRAERVGGRLSLVFILENLDTDAVRIGMNDHTVKLLDDRGEQWKLSQTTGLELNKFGSVGGTPVELPPRGKLTSRFSFITESQGGTTFDFVGGLIVRKGRDSTEQAVAFNELHPK
jgi:hypothetical protein